MQLTPPNIPELKIVELPEEIIEFNEFISDNRKITAKPELDEYVQRSYDKWFEQF